MKRRGLFVVFESAPKCGKSTLAKEVCKKISDFRHGKIIHKRGALSISPFSKKVIDNEIDKNLEYSSSFYWSDTVFDTIDTIKPNLTNGNLIIQERYDLSIVAYREIHGLGHDFLLLEEYLKRGLLINPDITIVPCADAETIKDRIKNDYDSTEVDKKFIEKINKHELMQKRIIHHLNALGRKYVLVNTTENSISEATEIILKKIKEGIQ